MRRTLSGMKISNRIKGCLMGQIQAELNTVKPNLGGEEKPQQREEKSLNKGKY